MNEGTEGEWGKQNHIYYVQIYITYDKYDQYVLQICISKNFKVKKIF